MAQEGTDKTKENIYNVALDLFLEKGFEATTVEDIAERSGMSPTDFSKYFPQKESILPSFLRKHIEDVREKIQARMDQETLTSDKLRAIYLALTVIVEENESLIQWVLIESLRLRAYHQEKESVFNAIIDFTVKAIQAGQEKGEVFLSIDPLKIAQILESVFFFTAVSWISFGKKVPLKEDLMTKVESVLQGILTDEAKSVMLSVDEQERRKGEDIGYLLDDSTEKKAGPTLKERLGKAIGGRLISLVGIPKGMQLKILRERNAAILPKLYKQLTQLLGKREGMRIYKELYRKAHNESMLPFEKMVLSGEVKTLYDAFKKAIPMFALFGMKMDAEKVDDMTAREIQHTCPYPPIFKKLGIKEKPCDIICEIDVQLSREMGFMDGKISQKKADGAPYCIFEYRLMKEPVRKAS